jgi:hypothetical protein
LQKDINEKYDLVIFQITAPYKDSDGQTWGVFPNTFATIKFGSDCKNIALGDPVKIYGYPETSGGYNLSITEGIISSIENNGQILTSAKVDSGNSGGLAMSNACLIGVPSAIISGNFQNFGVIIPVEIINQFVGQSINNIDATLAPSCTISISPSTIMLGGDADDKFKIIGPVTKTIFREKGILSYIGDGLVEDYPEISPGREASYKIRPSTIGIGTETIEVYGPGGSSSCSASITVESNKIYDKSKTIIIANPVTYHLGGKEELRSCPADSCGITVWGTTNATATIKQKNGDWYYALIVEESLKGHPYNTGGWLPSNLVPEDIKQKLQN